MEVTELDALQGALADVECSEWGDGVAAAAGRRLEGRPHGDLPQWREILARLPAPVDVRCTLDADVVTVRSETSLGNTGVLAAGLGALHPWRKGPFDLHGVEIDAEWRSDRKWRRVQPHLAALDGRRVLDVGCGNGYYLWRMLGRGARLVVGIDPSQLFWIQFLAVKRLLGGRHPVFMAPIALEDAPPVAAQFDTVFSMGVLYHRRSPIDHLLALRQLLRPGGELVIESLVVEGGDDRVLMPANRYARMRNVWFVPSTPMLERWLARTGFCDIATVDVTATGHDEQRPTAWMRFESLSDALDPADPDRTIEGYPAPRRAIVVAATPG